MEISGSDIVTSRRNGKSKMLRNLKKQIYDSDVWRSSAAEFLATFLFLFILCITYMMPSTASNGSFKASANVERSNLQANIGIALAYATMIQCFENISGGHMNPAISVAMFIAGHIKGFKAILYTIAQMTGAFSAVALCFGLFPNHSQQERVISKLHDGVSPFQGFGIEILQNFVLTVAWLATYLTSKQQLGSSALPVGVAVLGNSLWAGQLTGSNSNPARSLPPAIISKTWENLWVFTLGPLVGSIFGALLYVHVFASGSLHKKRRPIHSTGRNIEGESVKSDQEAIEHLQALRQEAEIQTTNFIAPRSDSSSPACSQQQAILYSPNNLRNPPTSVNPVLPNGSASSLSRPNRYNLPRAQSFCRQTSVPVQRTQSMFSPLSYMPPNGLNSANVTLTRENSRVPSRSSTSCGPLIAKSIKQNGNMNSYSSGKFANAMAPLLNEEIR